MNERIKRIIEHKHLTASKFAATIGVAQTTLSGHLSGQRSVSTDVVCAILNAFEDIDANWLLTGRGNMIKNSAEICTEQKPSHEREIAELREKIKYLEGQNDLLNNLIREQMGLNRYGKNEREECIIVDFITYQFPLKNTL